ncbi:MAG: 4-(cytidine 5'-diphospho)-2-C-methyl-D-erythritol kinase, partial [Lachnospiraceae bacterium]|nr:4-(cytidine 5'-diphospho)-2-C-methyl-D-erythritol kinase [Lachnospiraceae bacterium]
MIKSIKAPAKINLQLDVKEKNKDNYHDIYTIMQTVSLYDTLTFDIKKKADIKDDIVLTCTKSYIPTDENNLCYKAIRYIKDRYSITDTIHLHIKNAIPSGGGLGGGSSD